MANISNIIKEHIQAAKELEALTKQFEKEKDQYLKKINRLKEQERIIAIGIDLDKIELGRSILRIHGNPYAMNNDIHKDSDTIAQCAIRDILDGCKHLHRRYFGNKVYAHFYQRCDCEYGLGPTYGDIVDYVGLKEPGKELTDDEVEAAVYYLTVWPKLQEIENP